MNVKMIRVEYANGQGLGNMKASQGMITKDGGRIIRINETTITVFYSNRKPLEMTVREKPSAITILLNEAKKYGFKYMTRNQFEKSLSVVDV